MTYTIEDNEFTWNELRDYLRAAYGKLVNGNEIKPQNIWIWLKLGKLPELYGGNAIRLSRTTFGGVPLIEVNGLTREDVSYVSQLGSKQLPEVTNKRPVRKQRTQLYYQLARKKPRSAQNVIPNNWKELGIKRNQFK